MKSLAEMYTQEDVAQYNVGFNYGYLIEKHRPELARLLDRGQNRAVPLLQGFSDGRSERAYEKMINQPGMDENRDWKEIRHKDKNHDRDTRERE